jgi:hypothetical protein
MKQLQWLLLLGILGVVAWVGYGVFKPGNQGTGRAGVEGSSAGSVGIERLTQQKLKCKGVFKTVHKQLQAINSVIRNNLSADKPKQARQNAQLMVSALSQWSRKDQALTDCRTQFIALSKGYLIDTEHKVDVGVIVQSLNTDLVITPKRLPPYQSADLDALIATLRQIVNGKITPGMFKLYSTQSRPVFSYFKARLRSEEQLEMRMDEAFKGLKRLGASQ